MGGKWLELLREIAPHVSRVAFLFNPAQAPTAEYYLNSFKAGAARSTSNVSEPAATQSCSCFHTRREIAIKL